jgi:hypothetical protein
MAKFSGLGQLVAVLDLANQAQYNAANSIIEDRRRKGEQKLSLKEIQQQERLAKLDIGFKYKELEKKDAHSKRRDQLFKDIALYAGIGVGTLVILITLGVMLVGSKRESQFEYLIEGEGS